MCSVIALLFFSYLFKSGNSVWVHRSLQQRNRFLEQVMLQISMGNCFFDIIYYGVGSLVCLGVHYIGRAVRWVGGLPTSSAVRRSSEAVGWKSESPASSAPRVPPRCLVHPRRPRWLAAASTYERWTAKSAQTVASASSATSPTTNQRERPTTATANHS